MKYEPAVPGECASVATTCNKKKKTPIKPHDHSSSLTSLLKQPITPSSSLSTVLKQSTPSTVLKQSTPSTVLKHSTVLRQSTPSTVLKQSTPSTVLKHSTVLRQSTPSTVLKQSTPSTILKQSTSSTNHEKSSPITEIDHDKPIVINSESKSPVKVKPWISSPSALVTLFPSDKLILESPHAWLNDKIVDSAQRILRNQCDSTIGGWQTTLFEQKPSMFAHVSSEDFIQIVLIDRSHWIVVSNIGCDCGTVNVYDSLYNTVTLKTICQICAFWKCPTKFGTFRLVNIQRQPNSSDCGLFAISSATELVHGKNPILSYWDTSKMRGHLMKCLEQEKIECFPQLKSRRIPSGNFFRRIEKKELFCVCRMPNDKTRSMIQCDSCKQWFHENCMGIDESKSSEEHWKCHNCI